jgi:hypothetical protein
MSRRGSFSTLGKRRRRRLSQSPSKYFVVENDNDIDFEAGDSDNDLDLDDVGSPSKRRKVTGTLTPLRLTHTPQKIPKTTPRTMNLPKLSNLQQLLMRCHSHRNLLRAHRSFFT